MQSIPGSAKTADTTPAPLSVREACFGYPSVTHPCEASCTVLMYFQSVPRLAL